MVIVEIEDLELAKVKLPTINSDQLVKSHLKGKLLSSSELPKEIVDGKSHSFLQAIYYAYCDHRPFVLTPESIWLLILQAFSVNMNNNSQKLFTKKPFDLEKKEELIVIKNNIDWENKEDCNEIISGFCENLDQKIENNFVQNLSSKFSTTTVDEETVFKITTLNTVKQFFEFIAVSFICGIPKIYLAGEKEDWISIKKRLEYLGKFDFKWFVNDITIIINRIIQEFDDKVDDNFWMNIFKIHTTEEYGNPEYVDGWITKFFPFSKTGKRLNKNYFKQNSFQSVVKEIHPQIVKLDFRHNLLDKQRKLVSEKQMIIVAGFMGIIQNEKTLALKPNLGWVIGENNDNFTELVEANKNNILVYHNLNKFPRELLKLKEIEELDLNFDSVIKVPEAIKKLEIHILRLNGKINHKEKKKIRKLFRHKNTMVFINNEDINTTLINRFKLKLLELSPFHQKFIDY